MGNLSGKAYAINTLSPMRWYTRPLLKLLFRLAPYLKPTRQLKKLSFIHFARWAIVPRHRWPYLGPPQRRDRTRYDYLLFCSNFNGTWDQYIAAFSDILPAGINRIWGWTLSFPGAVPLGPFERFIRLNQRDTDYYYSAYPHATTTDVKKALFVAQELERLADSTRGDSPVEFARRYQEFLTRVQNSLGDTGAPPRVC